MTLTICSSLPWSPTWSWFSCSWPGAATLWECLISRTHRLAGRLLIAATPVTLKLPFPVLEHAEIRRVSKQRSNEWTLTGCRDQQDFPHRAFCSCRNNLSTFQPRPGRGRLSQLASIANEASNFTPRARARAAFLPPFYFGVPHDNGVGAPPPHKYNFLALIMLVVSAESRPIISAEPQLFNQIQECRNTAYAINVSNKIPPLAVTGPPSCMPGVGVRHQHGRTTGSYDAFP